jgi:peroxiredoxin
MSVTDASEQGTRASPARGDHGFFRRFIFPVLVIAAIAGAIWWLDSRDSGETSSTGERYGPKSLPAELQATGVDVAAEEGALAPDFLLETLDEGDLRLSGLRGSPVVLNFWATWCEPCRKEMPLFVDAYDRYREEGVQIVAVNLQEGKTPVREFAADYGMKFTIGIDRDGEVGDQYRLLGLPTTFFIGGDGIIRSVYQGPVIEEDGETNVQSAIEGSELQARIEELLAAESAD